MTRPAIRRHLPEYALIVGLLTFAALMASTGLDLRTSMVLPILASGFVVYSAIAYYIDRVKSGR